MFDRVSDITGGSGDGDADLGDLPDLLRDDEELAHVLANGGSIEYTTEGRTTTVEPSGDEQAYLLVTDERVLYVLGDQPDTIEIDVEMTDYKASHVRKGLLSSKLQVKTDTESIMFAPDEGDIDETGEYIERVASCWADMDDAIGRAEAIVEEFEESVAGGEGTTEQFLPAKSNLSEARSNASRYAESPGGKIRLAVDEAERELQRRRIEAWLDRVETCHEAIEPALETGEYGEACTMYAEAASAVESARAAIEDVDEAPAEASDRVDALEADLQSAGEQFLAETDAECEEALDADEPAVAIEAWEDAFDRYSAAVDAGWNGHAPVSGEALELQLTWVTASLLDALGSHATMLEQQGDDADGEAAQEYYDDAIEWFERAEEFAADHPERSVEEFADAAQRVSDKQLEASGWEFGNA